MVTRFAMHCGWGPHFGYCAGCGMPITLQEEAAFRPVPGRTGRRGRFGGRGPRREDEFTALREQIEALREELASVAERLAEVEGEA